MDVERQLKIPAPPRYKKPLQCLGKRAQPVTLRFILRRENNLVEKNILESDSSEYCPTVLEENGVARYRDQSDSSYLL